MPPIAVLVALADPTRCRILEILRSGPQPVHVLAGEFDISRPAISRHLRVLKEARLISEKKIGRENRYGMHPNKLKPVQDWLDLVNTPSEDAPVSKSKAKTKAKKAKTAPKAVKPVSAPVVPLVAEPVVAIEPVVVEPVVVVAEKPKAAAKPKPTKLPEEPAISQMGFDF